MHWPTPTPTPTCELLLISNRPRRGGSCRTPERHRSGATSSGSSGSSSGRVMNGLSLSPEGTVRCVTVRYGTRCSSARQVAPGAARWDLFVSGADVIAIPPRHAYVAAGVAEQQQQQQQWERYARWPLLQDVLGGKEAACMRLPMGAHLACQSLMRRCS